MYNIFRAELCDKTEDKGGYYVGDRIMCPECETWCTYYKLGDKSCSISKIAYLSDNYGTVAFSIIMSIWGKEIEIMCPTNAEFVYKI